MAEKLADEVERTDPTVHAFLDFDRPRLLGAAAALDQRPRARHGPLHGLAIAVKEVFDVTSHRCCWGLPSLHDRIATRDAALVAKLKKLRSEEHTSELQSLMRTSYAVFCLKKKTKIHSKKCKYTHY